MSQNDAAHLALARHTDACIVGGLTGEKESTPQGGRIGGRRGQMALLWPGASIEFMQVMREDSGAAYQVMCVADRGVTPCHSPGTVKAVRYRIEHARLRGRIYPE